MLKLKREIPFTNGLYWVTQYGEIINRDNTAVLIKIGELGKFVTIKVHSNDINVLLSILVAITYCNIQIAPDLWENVDPIYNDGDTTNIIPSNISYRFKNGPLEVPGYSGFFYIPYHTQYAINETGCLLNLKTNYFKQWSISLPQEKKNITGGYFFTSAGRDIGSSRLITRHRSLCLTFKKYDVDPKNLIVNHLDGVPGNDWLDNLEWTTYAKNNQHAYDSGLRPNSTRSVLYKNWKTGEEGKFVSIEKCRLHVGCKRTLIEQRLRRNRSATRYHDGWRFKYDDGVNWPALSDKVTEVTNEPVNIVARNIFTGEIHAFESSLQASKITNVNSTSISQAAHKETIQSLNGFNFRFMQDRIKWPNHSARHLEIYSRHPLRPPRGVVVKNILLNQEMFFTSPREAAKHFNVSEGQLCNRCKSNEAFDKAFLFSFYNLHENLGSIIE